MKYNIIGCGKLGVAIGNALMLRGGGNDVHFYEPMINARILFRKGEFRELEMVAKSTGNRARWGFGEDADIHIITAGKPRSSPRQSKAALYKTNAPIVKRLAKRCRGKVYIATNPPKEICRDVPNALPLRDCVDELRQACWGKEWARLNDQVLAAKGYTSYGPAAAIAKEVLQWAHVR